MTDGAGLINKAALLKLKKKFDWDDWPTAIQCRINGNKVSLSVIYMRTEHQSFVSRAYCIMTRATTTMNLASGFDRLRRKYITQTCQIRL